MNAEQYCDVLEALQKHIWPKQCRRLNIVAPEFRQHRSDQFRRMTLCPTASESFSRGNKRCARLFALLEAALPPDFPRDEHLFFTVNKNVRCYPHKDSGNRGEGAVLFLGDFQGGQLFVEDGRVFSKKGVWHRFDSGRLLHWNAPHAGTKYSVVAYTQGRSLRWGRGVPKEKGMSQPLDAAESKE